MKNDEKNRAIMEEVNHINSHINLGNVFTPNPRLEQMMRDAGIIKVRRNNSKAKVKIIKPRYTRY